MTNSTAVGLLAIAVPGVVAVFFILDGITRDSSQLQHIPSVAVENQNVVQMEISSSSSTIIIPNAKSWISGQVRVVDGDTIDVKGTRIRLHGIDAPEKGQRCENEGKFYNCGQKAASFLRQITANTEVVCSPMSQDRYGRTIATCSIGEADLGATMVANGWALAYRKYNLIYVPFEDQAKQARRGIWTGQFLSPHKWRAGERL